MATISSLSRADALYDSDEVPIFSPTQGDTRKATLPQIAAYVYAKNEGEPDETIYSLAVTGNSVTVVALPTAPGASVWVQLTLSAPAASATVILPGVDDRSEGQEVLVTCTQSISTLTVNGNGGTVRGAPTSLTTNGFFKLRYDNVSNTWYRVS